MSILVSVFWDDLKAYQAGRVLAEWQAKGHLALNYAAIINRHARGKPVVRQIGHRRHEATGGGALVGALAGAPAGPIAATIGAIAGTMIGSAADSLVTGDAEAAGLSRLAGLPDGQTVIVADVDENDVVRLTNLLESAGAAVRVA